MNASFDPDEVLQRLGGDRELLREVAGIFATDAPEMLAAIERAIAGHDPAELFRAAHKLKGSMANFSAHDGTAAALVLERLGAAGTLEGAGPALDRLRFETERLREALAAFANGDEKPAESDAPSKCDPGP